VQQTFDDFSWLTLEAFEPKRFLAFRTYKVLESTLFHDRLLGARSIDNSVPLCPARHCLRLVLAKTADAIME
jgi:hypothetical protein